MTDDSHPAGDAPVHALVGYTGFVGSNLVRQHSFDETFNSTNIDQIAGRGFDLVVCAGAPAEKWKANAAPERDLENIQRLVRALGQANASHVVLISTVDVFSAPVDVDEGAPVPMTGLHAYGRNRRVLEEILSARFSTTVIRLPGLFGPGLKKNVIHDLMHDHEVHKIDSRGVFQFYDVERLWRDIETALANELPLVHLSTEPVSAADVARAGLGIEFTNEILPNPARYDVHTRYADLFGGAGRYVEDRTTELDRIGRFFEREKPRASGLGSNSPVIPGEPRSGDEGSTLPVEPVSRSRD